MTALDEELIELRREIHRRPELAGDERAIGHGVRAMAGLLTDRLAAGSTAGNGRGDGRGRRSGVNRER
ncbi:hypothetical protein [Actinoplanes sp. NPDC049599]|uniref:hypothetical protein n=1 Tax=Actinoplanes sp. NPDC049599 TaxID=3363903 RepID=UPI003789B51F